MSANVKKIQKQVKKMPKSAVKTGKQLQKKVHRFLVKKKGDKKFVVGGAFAAVAVLAGVACVIAAIVKNDADADIFADEE